MIRSERTREKSRSRVTRVAALIVNALGNRAAVADNDRRTALRGRLKQIRELIACLDLPPAVSRKAGLSHQTAWSRRSRRARSAPSPFRKCQVHGISACRRTGRQSRCVAHDVSGVVGTTRLGANNPW